MGCYSILPRLEYFVISVSISTAPGVGILNFLYDGPSLVFIRTPQEIY